MLVDSSAWIEFFKLGGIQFVKDRVSEELKNQTAGFSEPVEYEVLSGCSRPGQRELVEDTFGISHRFAVERHDWIAATEVNLKLRKKGIQIAVIDLLLAVISVRIGLSILTRDSDFEIIRDNALPALRVERLK